MKKVIAFLMAISGLFSGCSHSLYQNKNVESFSRLISDPDVVVLDVRTAEEFAEGHLAEAINIDVKQDDFIEKAQRALPSDKKIAVYCRSGRRSGMAAVLLAQKGFQVTNLKGGIIAWKEQGKAVTIEK